MIAPPCPRVVVWDDVNEGEIVLLTDLLRRATYSGTGVIWTGLLFEPIRETFVPTGVRREPLLLKHFMNFLATKALPD